jgi:hypothetical protein
VAGIAILVCAGAGLWATFEFGVEREASWPVYAGLLLVLGLLRLAVEIAGEVVGGSLTERRMPAWQRLSGVILGAGILAGLVMLCVRIAAAM